MKIILRCVAATCLLLFSVSALGDDHRRSKGFVMFNAGTLIVGIEQSLFLPPPTDPVPDVPISIIEEKSRGTLGRADLKTFSVVVGFGFDEDECPEGFGPFAITEDTIVLTFHDLSQLVGKGTTFVCVDENRTQGVLGTGEWVSGSRRFADVMGGEYHLSSTATPQSTNGQYYSTVGSINGQIERQ